MIAVCIYERNRGLGKCAGAVTKVKVARKTTRAWQGLHDLAERLREVGEEPGVCQAHEKRAGENGYLLDVAPPPSAGGEDGSPKAAPRSKSADHSKTGEA